MEKCLRCDDRPRRIVRTKKGGVRLGHLCEECKVESRAIRLRNTQRFSGMKSLVCAACGFVAKDRCQMDIDHIDGNRENNADENLQTLCANCHRLKTKMEKDADWSKRVVPVTVSVTLKLPFFD